jgi:hypothetical protein
MACWSDTSCVVAASGPAGSALLTVTIANGKASWRSLELPEGLVSVTAVSCAELTACWLAGLRLLPGQQPGGATSAVVYRDLGVGKLPGLPVPLTTSATTTTSTSAPAHSTTSLAPVIAQARWVEQALPVGVASIASLACPTISVCMGVGVLSSGAEVLLGAGLVGTGIAGTVAPPVTAG